MLDQHESANADIRLGDEIAPKVLETCRKLLKTDNFGLDDNFFESGGNSLLAMVLAVELENRFGIKIRPEGFFGRPTVRELCVSLKEGVRAGPISILPLTEGFAGRTLYFVHAAFDFSPLCERLSPDISASFVLINDREWLRQLMTGNDILAVLDQISGAYAEVIIAARHDGPLYLAGHSSGGIFAVETARHLEKRGVTPDYIFLFDTYLHPWLRRTIYDVLRNGLIVGKIRSMFAASRDPMFVPGNGGGKSGKTSDIERADVTSEVEFGLLLSKLREEVSEAYHGPESVPAWNTALFRATRMVDGRTRRKSSDLGWARSLQRKLSVVEVAADHFNMIKGQYAGIIADEINRLARSS
jgi:thioesterase domain-containing protein/acyl carrier protein